MAVNDVWYDQSINKTVVFLLKYFHINYLQRKQNFRMPLEIFNLLLIIQYLSKRKLRTLYSTSFTYLNMTRTKCLRKFFAPNGKFLSILYSQFENFLIDSQL